MQQKRFQPLSGPVAVLRRVLGPNGDLMAFSVLVSAALLAAVHQHVVSARHERTFPVPVAVRSENPTTAVFSFEPASVAVTLRGTQDDLATLDPSRLAVEISARNQRGSSGETLRIRPADILGTGNLKIVAVEPSSVDVRYDYMVTWPATGRLAMPELRGVPVQGEAEVEMPTNVTVVVHGSESKVAAFREKKILLPTSPVSVEGKTESFDATVAILVPPDSGISKVEPSTVRVHVKVTTYAAAGVEEDNAPLRRVSPQTAAAAPSLGSPTNSPPEGASPDRDAARDGDGPDGAEEDLPPPVGIGDGGAAAED